MPVLVSVLITFVVMKKLMTENDSEYVELAVSGLVTLTSLVTQATVYATNQQDSVDTYRTVAAIVLCTFNGLDEKPSTDEIALNVSRIVKEHLGTSILLGVGPVKELTNEEIDVLSYFLEPTWEFMASIDDLGDVIDFESDSFISTVKKEVEEIFNEPLDED